MSRRRAVTLSGSFGVFSRPEPVRLLAVIPFQRLSRRLQAMKPLPALLLFAFVALGNYGHAAENQRPNVIVLLTDDNGYGDLACHGNPELKTPNFDRLHSQSIRLTDFHVAPMCTPTRGQLMTGVDALRNGATSVSAGRSFIRRGIPTMAEIFAAG